jgi:prepilin-type N-terminal cleavage/methylation domain-containing protein
MRPPHRTRATGFSLVELLVAVALLGVLAVLLWRGLGDIIAQRERIDRDAAHLERVIRLLAQLERDVAQRAPDMVIPAAGEPTRGLPRALEVSLQRGGNAQLVVLRAAPDAGGPMRLERVRYFVAARALMREASPPGSSWPLQPPSPPLRLLDAVERLSVRLLTAEARTDAGSSAAVAGGNARVTGIEVSVERANGERYVRVVAL